MLVPNVLLIHSKVRELNLIMINNSINLTKEETKILYNLCFKSTYSTKVIGQFLIFESSKPRYIKLSGI